MKVIMIAATTLCGRISPAPLGSALDRLFLEKMRDRTDASLMGSGTLRRENPQMLGTKGLSKDRLRAFITNSGDIPLNGKKVFCDDCAPIFFTGEDCEGLASQLDGKVEVVTLPTCGKVLSLKSAMAEFARRGAKSVLVEGGALLNYHALNQQVIDEICLTITPKLSGDIQASGLADGPHPLGSPFLDAELLNCKVEENGEIFVHYKINYQTKG